MRKRKRKKARSHLQGDERLNVAVGLGSRKFLDVFISMRSDGR
jgi:hypothetical protein